MSGLCPRCGGVMNSAGFAIACGPKGASTRIELPASCKECREVDGELAIARALASGLLAPEPTTEENS